MQTQDAALHHSLKAFSALVAHLDNFRNPSMFEKIRSNLRICIQKARHLWISMLLSIHSFHVCFELSSMGVVAGSNFGEADYHRRRIFAWILHHAVRAVMPAGSSQKTN